MLFPVSPYFRICTSDLLKNVWEKGAANLALCKHCEFYRWMLRSSLRRGMFSNIQVLVYFAFQLANLSGSVPFP